MKLLASCSFSPENMRAFAVPDDPLVNW